ncbi:hypothetical protein MLD38_018826 [Melastoma candidum]|uniref:Uncharacterized protein n=1 Tax=Melastoma candidum TaxID=119954 RepID=A0ACB9QVK7_9MYRT|nr:hypothetical protein MLD38_018826 [Melastoma candidum]
MDPSYPTPDHLLGSPFLRSSIPRRSRLLHLHDPNSRLLLLHDYASRELNAFLWLSLFLLTSLLLRQLLRVFRLWIHARLIPGPPSPSFFGHSHLLRHRNLPDVLASLHDKYGSVVKLWLGPAQLLVSIKDRELVRDMLFKAEDKVPHVGRAFQLAFGRSSLFMTSFHEVRKRRELLAAELNHRMRGGSDLVPDQVMGSIMEKIRLRSAKGSIRCKTLSHHMAFSLMGSLVFGESFSGWLHATEYEDTLMSITNDFIFWASFTVTPFWKSGFWRYQHLCKKLKWLTTDMIHQCGASYEQLRDADWKRSNDSGNIYGSLGSAHGIMAGELLFEDAKRHLFPSEAPCANVMGVMFHGCLLTGGLICNMLARLAAEPEVQDQIYEEIVMARNNSSEDGSSSIDKIPLLVATIYESARLLPAWPLLQRSSVYNNFLLKSGEVIPARAVLVAPLNLIHSDDPSWGDDGSVFNPYRFLSSTSNESEHLKGPKENCEKKPSYILRDPNYTEAFFPFGYGTRACVGQKIVIRGVAALFSSLLEQYKIKLRQGPEANVKASEYLTWELLPSLEIVFTERNN